MTDPPPPPVRSGEFSLPFMQALADQGRAAFVFSDSRRLPVKEMQISDAEIRWIAHAPLTELPVRVDLENSYAVYSLSAPARSLAGAALIFPRADLQLDTLFQRHSRRALTDGKSFVQFELDGVRVRRPIRDLCRDGLSFITGSEAARFRAATKIPELEVEAPSDDFWIDGGPELASRVIPFSGEVRRVSILADGRVLIALRVRPQGTGAVRAWCDVVARYLCPNTETGGNRAGEVWGICESQYFTLNGKLREEFLPLRSDFINVARLLENPGAPWVGYQVLWNHPEHDRGRGTFSYLKAYRYMWCPHQLALRAGQDPRFSRHQIRREVYLHGFENILYDGEVRWIGGFIRDPDDPQYKSRWLRFHLRFAREFEDPSSNWRDTLSLAWWFRLVEVVCEHLVPDPDDPFDVGLATPEQRSVILDTIQRDRPFAYTQSLDLVPERFDLRQVSEDFRRAGLDRNRILLAASLRGELVAAAVVEDTSDGVNLFRIFDCVRLFCLDEDVSQEVRDRAYASLLARAGQWFQHERKKTRFMWLQEDDFESLPHYASAPAFLDRGKGFYWLLRAGLLFTFLDRVWKYTSVKSPSGDKQDV